MSQMMYTTMNHNAQLHAWKLKTMLLPLGFGENNIRIYLSVGSISLFASYLGIGVFVWKIGEDFVHYKGNIFLA